MFDIVEVFVAIADNKTRMEGKNLYTVLTKYIYFILSY